MPLNQGKSMEYPDNYFVFDKDLGRPQQPGTKAYGRPVAELTEEQRQAFDLHGWLLIEGVLAVDESAAAKEHIHTYHAFQGQACSCPTPALWELTLCSFAGSA